MEGRPLKRWLPLAAVLSAGGVIGAAALAGVALLVLGAIAANAAVWFLVIPWVAGDARVWTATIILFLVFGVATALVAFWVARGLVRLIRRRMMETKDGLQA